MRKIRTKDISIDSIAALIHLQNEAGFFVVHDAAHRPIPGVTSDVLLANAELLDKLRGFDNSTLQLASQRLATWLAETITIKNAFSSPGAYNVRATFYTLASLHAYNPALISQTLLAQAVRYLVTHEAAVGGPYTDTDGGIETSTNIAIDRFVRQVAQPLPKLSAYIAKTAQKPQDTFYAPARMHVRNLHHNSGHNSKVPTRQKPNAKIPASVAAAIQADLQTVPTPLRKDMRKLIDRIMQSEAANEIVALAAHFAQALAPRTVTSDVTNMLGVANTYTWIAYTLYDDFLDDEGQASKLPLANIALRHGITAFQQALPDNTAFQKQITKAFDTIETANAWEVAHCRWRVDSGHLHIGKMPEYSNLHMLCERSLSHSLPVIGVLIASGNSFADSIVRDTQAVFEEYLVIRQLSDDLRDWQEDIRAGHISYVVAQLLHDAGVTEKSISFAKLLPKLEKQFWQKTLPKLNQEIQIRGKRARQLLSKHRTIAANNILAILIKGLEDAAERTRDEQQRADQFLDAYRQN